MSRCSSNLKKFKHPLVDSTFWLDTSEATDVGLLKRLPAVHKHIRVWRLHKVVLYVPDVRVIEAVPGSRQGAVAQSCVVAHVEAACVVLKRTRSKCSQMPVCADFKEFFKHTTQHRNI